MRLLADDDVHAQIVAWLRMNGHDVLWLPELDAPPTDQELLDKAASENRVLLTSDVELAELTFHQHNRRIGLILLRLDSPTIAGRLKLLQSQWAFFERHAAGVSLTLDKGILGFAG
jgi:predicted nuclease of predicted toxin-antitoxin system